MTTKQISTSASTTSASTGTSSAAATSNATTAAHILYRMANLTSGGSNHIVTSHYGMNTVTEPITPVTPMIFSATMLQQGGAHFPNFSSNNAIPLTVQSSMAPHTTTSGNFIPVFIGSGGTTTIKQEPGMLPIQIQQQFQNFQQQQQRLYVTTGEAPQVHTVRMSNVMNNSNPTMAGIGSPSSMNGGSSSGNHSSKGRSGGRRPNKQEKLTPEEDERRKVRRERNKQAAARCRKRRMDHTNILTEETDGLQDIQNQLKTDIEELQREKAEIEFLLQSHRAICSREVQLDPDVTMTPPRPSSQTMKSFLPDSQNMSPANPPNATSSPPAPMTVPTINITCANSGEHSSLLRKGGLGNAATRPASLSVKPTMASIDCGNSSLPTPSPTKLLFNFEHCGLTPTGLTPTGLTPLIPSCSAEVGVHNRSPPRPTDPTGDISPNTLASL